MINTFLCGSKRMVSFHQPKEYLKSFVNGKFYDSKNTLKSLPVYSPVNGQMYGSLECCSQYDVDYAVDNCSIAYKSWKQSKPQDRSAILLKASQFLTENVNYIAELETMDTGKLINETKNDVLAAAETLQFFASQVFRLEGMHIPMGNDAYIYTIKEPLGVCLGIGAWNFPITNIAWKVAPALCTGNTMLYKPSEFAPLTSCLFAEILSKCGLPDGCLNIIQGDGETGTFLVNNQKIKKVSFTGSCETGKKISVMAANLHKRVTLEMGGKSPLIIFEDADMKTAVNGALMANFFTQGQVCSNATKVYVHESIYDSFKLELINATKVLKVGSPYSYESKFGAMISLKQLEIVVDFVKRALNEGAKLVYGNPERIVGDKVLENGFYLEPMILENCTDSMELTNKEIFGPVITLLSFKTEEEVIERANNTPFGLAAGVITKDIGRVTRVVSKFDASTIYVNTYNVYPAQMSFGGRKQSGYGRENGIAALDGYIDVKSVYVETKPLDFPF